MENKPELLLPAGNTESFFAALQAGADALYLGLNKFNARGRAQNFTEQQLNTVLSEAHKKGVNVYITLNTVIKNTELPQLIEYLHFLKILNVDGIIIQDWGVFSLAKEYFPELKIHASTQLGIHNSPGSNFAEKNGFKRVVVARELTLPELKNIVTKSGIEIEVFVHGALCYSFSGMCLFSSYLGGRGANRGMCAQPCRREYHSENDKKFLFNLKDNQLLDFIPLLAKTGVKSLKIEGRLKSGEYTFRVGKAYRKVLDNPLETELAKSELAFDLGRQKTSYFFGGDVKNSISDETGTGIYLGEIQRVIKNEFLLETNQRIERNFRLRIHLPGVDEPVYFTVGNFRKENFTYFFQNQNIQIKNGSRVFLVKLQEQKFQNKLEAGKNFQPVKISPSVRNSILTTFSKKAIAEKEELFFRINSTDWFSRINFNELDGLFLAFSKPGWKMFDFNDPFLNENREKIYMEFPKFIAEGSVGFYTRLAEKMVQNGFRNFVIGQLSQIEIIPEESKIVTSENVYAFNDAAIQFYKNKGISSFIYPFEIDFETLESLNDKTGIVPLFFYPELFYSRMPVHLHKNDVFESEDEKTKFRRIRKDGVTIIVPDRPVSILQHKKRLNSLGFKKFLIDVSYDTFSKNRLKTLKTRLLKSEQLQPSTSFNFIKGMK